MANFVRLADFVRMADFVRLSGIVTPISTLAISGGSFLNG